MATATAQRATTKGRRQTATPHQAPAAGVTAAHVTSRATTGRIAATAAAIDVGRAVARFRLLSDPTRLQILIMLAGGEMHVTAICERMGQSQPSTSHHLSLLRVSELIEARRQGKHNFYGLAPAGWRALESAGIASVES